MQQDTKDLMDEFRKLNGQEQVEYKPVASSPRPSLRRPVLSGVCVTSETSRISSDFYREFLSKYWDMENRLSEFTPRDLAYFFREKAKENKVKYVIANMKRDIGIFRRLRKDYTIEELCLMTEFIFTSDQDYINPGIVQPTILVSSCAHTIYHDTMLWVDDKYVPRRLKKFEKREWVKSGEENVSIGEWK